MNVVSGLINMFYRKWHKVHYKTEAKAFEHFDSMNAIDQINQLQKEGVVSGYQKAKKKKNKMQSLVLNFYARNLGKKGLSSLNYRQHFLSSEKREESKRMEEKMEELKKFQKFLEDLK